MIRLSERMTKFRSILFAQKKNIPATVITISVLLFSLIVHYLGLFDRLELRLYDYLVKNVRGPLTGWMVKDSSYNQRGTDVVLVEIDDEAWRLVPETWPYSRGQIWAHALDNLAKAGAKVVLFDILFDTPERQSEYLRYFVANTNDSSLASHIPVHGDTLFAEAIARSRQMGCEVILSTKIATESSLTPPQYLVKPVESILSGGPQTGLVNSYLDEDGVIRRYPLGLTMGHEPDKLYLSLGLKAIRAYDNIADSILPVYNEKKRVWLYGPYRIPQLPLANSYTFLINYYGPTSNRRYFDLPRWETFPVFSLSQILDTRDITLRDPVEDIDWMEQYISGELPEWIMAITDTVQRNKVITSMGLDESAAPKKSPFEGKIVIIGVSIEVIHDLMETPFYHYKEVPQFMPGMEVHANAIQTILDQNHISQLGGTTTNIGEHQFPVPHFFLIILFILVPLIIVKKQNPILAALILFLLGGVYISFVYGNFMGDLFYMYKSLVKIIPIKALSKLPLLKTNLPEPGESYLFPTVIPLFAMTLTYVSDLIYALITEHRKKLFLRESFGAYVSPKLIEDMYETNHKPELGGVERKGTAFFSDIVSFSSLSELVSPSELIIIMNDYFTEMTNILLAEGGTLDKYIGDAIVAFWGAPLPVENQEIEACITALKMEEALGKLRDRWQKSGYPDKIWQMHHRIGLHTGSIVTGNVGSSTRMNYTMMGDDVNTGARLESSAKQYGIFIHVSESVHHVAKDSFEFRFIDNVRVKGKTHPIKTYELLGHKGQLTEEQYGYLELYHQAIDVYHDRDWHRARALFDEAVSKELHKWETSPSKVYLTRCEHFIQSPPEESWDGVWTLTQK